METIKIPGVPVNASRIGLGTWAIGGWMWGGTEESEAISTIHTAIDNGINLIDTAPVYGFGHSEELVGKALEGGRREGAIIATKVGLDWGSGKILRNSTPARLRRELEASLTTIQPPYNLFEREIEKDVLPYAERNGLVVLAYGALCRGLLTRKITAKTEFKGDDLRKVDPKFQQPRLGDYLAAVARLDAFARERYGKTVLALAV